MIIIINRVLKFTILIAVFLSAPSVVSAELRTVEEIFTEQSRSLAGWKKRDNACLYAKASAKHKAVKKCKTKHHGKIIAVTSPGSDKPKKIIEQCTDCTQSKYFNEWYCTGKVTVKCEYTVNSEDPGVINSLRGQVQKSNPNYTETNNPCSKDTQTRACIQYRESLKKNTSQGVRN